MALLEFENVSYSYPDGTRALDGVSLSVERGEFVCVIGANGSGKSTLARHVNGLLLPESGRVVLDGDDTADRRALARIRSSVGMVFQNPDDQIVATLVEDDVAFGPSNLGVPADELRRRVDEALENVGLAGFQRRNVATLSGGEKQRVAIAGALAMEPSVLVLDEATSMLDPDGRTAIMRVCRKLNERGLAIVLITHALEEAACADRVIALHDGRIALDGPPRDVLSQGSELRKLSLEPPFAARFGEMLEARGVTLRPYADLSQLADQLAPLLRHASLAAPPPAGRTAPDAHPAVLEFEDVAVSYRNADDGAPSRALSNITFSLGEGDLLGIAGRTGSGKSTLLQLASALLEPTEGRVLYRRRALADKRVARQARSEIGIAFQYPERQLFASTVFDDVAFGPRNQGLPADEVRRRVDDVLALVGLDAENVTERSPFALSGGQQRLVALAGVLALRPSVLLLDEPTAGLDPRAREGVHRLIAELAANGTTIVIASHDMDALALLCTRMLLLNHGRIAAAGTPDEAFARKNVLATCGLNAPNTLNLMHLLGIEAPLYPTPDALATALADALDAHSSSS